MILNCAIFDWNDQSPDDRYSSAYGIRADLKECLKRLKYASESCVEVSVIQHVVICYTRPKHKD